MCSSCVSSCQVLCLEIEQTQQASDSAELERWSKLSSSARDELATLKCILGSMKDNQVPAKSTAANEAVKVSTSILAPTITEKNIGQFLNLFNLVIYHLNVFGNSGAFGGS